MGDVDRQRERAPSETGIRKHARIVEATQIMTVRESLNSGAHQFR